jgi:hypothetical protein
MTVEKNAVASEGHAQKIEIKIKNINPYTPIIVSASEQLVGRKARGGAGSV